MTRRFIRLSLAVLMIIFCAFSAIAEESQPEITFRKIPWGSSVSDVRSILEAEIGEEITLKKTEPPYFLIRPELGYYSEFGSDGLDYYEIPGGGLYFQDVYVDQIHLFFQNDLLVQAAYFFRVSPEEHLKQMCDALDAQYGPHTVSATKQITDVDFYRWEINGNSITAEEVQIEAFLFDYYSDIVIVYKEPENAQS